MIEHEKKYRLKKITAVREYLMQEGFMALDEIYQKDIYFSRPDVDFMKTKECLRIRVEDKRIEITYKPPTTALMHESGAIWKQEINVAVKSEVDARNLFLAIGSVELCTVEKRRTEFKKGNLTAAFDKITGVGEFIELEILSEGEDSSAITAIESLATQLGLQDSDVVTLPYRDLCMQAV